MLWKKLRAIDAGYLLTKLSKRFVYVSWVSIKTTKYFKKLLFLQPNAHDISQPSQPNPLTCYLILLDTENVKYTYQADRLLLYEKLPGL